MNNGKENEDKEWIPLLSGKSLEHFTPLEYMQHVRSLFFKRPPKKAPSKKKPFIAKRTKTGKLSLKVNRNPAFLTPSEMTLITETTGHTLEELQAVMKGKGIIKSDA